MEFEGVISNIRYRNEENGYTVATLSTSDGDIPIVGKAAFIKQGDNVKIDGELVYHPTYGEQVSFVSLEILMPSTEAEIINYLSSAMIPTVGPKTAQLIVEKFGTDTLRILEEEPRQLLKVKGIGKKRLPKIIEGLAEQREMRETMFFCQKYGISASLSVKLHRKYGVHAVELVSENPYRLIDDIQGIGFKTADQIAISLGIRPDSDERVIAGLKYILSLALGEGHTYLPVDRLQAGTSKLLTVKEDLVEKCLRDMVVKRSDVSIVNHNEEMCVYLRKYLNAENRVANKLLKLAHMKDNTGYNFGAQIDNLEQEIGMEFAEKQKEAIYNSMKNGVSVITGGPGTGKTTVINGIIRICEHLGLDIALAAPTGRAAKRMAEATGYEAKTIHRLLEYAFADEENERGFRKDENDPLDFDVIIIDEASMLDIMLTDSLLKAVQDETKLILVGDVDQLPAVGAGNVLSDIIMSDTVSVVRLDEIFRQAEESMIVVNAHLINKGEYPRLNIEDKDFYFIHRQTESGMTNTILELLGGRLTSYYGIKAEDIQVLSPMKRGEAGVNNLNKKLQEKLNPESPEKEEKRIGEDILRVGDKVMQIRNNYSAEWKLIRNGMEVDTGEGIYNGDIGFVTEISDGFVKVLFDGDKLVEYEPMNLDELVLSYATTVHKSQGSEFPAVVMPISYGPPMLNNRNLLYTAITRAKKLVVLVGDEKYLRSMISNSTMRKRYSQLDEKMRKLAEWKE